MSLPNMMDGYPEGTPIFEVHGRYGYWFVDEYRVGDTGRATYGSVDASSKKNAEKIAGALNTAVRRALKIGYERSQEEAYARGYDKGHNDGSASGFREGQKDGMASAFKAALGS